MTGFWRPPYFSDAQLARGGGGSGGSQTSYSSTNIPDWLSTASEDVINKATDLANRDYQANPYAQVANLSPDQQQAYATIEAMQGGANPAFQASEQQAGGLIGQAAPLTAGALTGTAQQLFNPYQTAVVQPAVAQMRQGLAQSQAAIGAQAYGQGAYGGARQGIEEGTAAAQEATQEGQLVGQLQQQGWNTASQQAASMLGQNLQLGTWATQLAPQLATQQQQQTATDAGLLESAGRAQQAQQQAVLDQDSQNWQSWWDYPYQSLQTLESAVGSVPYSTTSYGQTQTTGASSNTFGSILGGLSSAAGLLSSGAKIAAMF